MLAAALLALAAPVAVEIAEETAELDFSYAWPAEAAAVPFLDRRFRADMAWMKEEALKYARDDRAETQADGRDFHQHYFARKWETAGQTGALLSLVAATGTFTGGAHPNSAVSTTLWDRGRAEEIAAAGLFDRPGGLESLLHAPFCKALDKERLERRQGETIDGDFGECPTFGELAVVPTDDDSDGRFETIHIVASPYVAGPYAEGEYDIVLPVTPALVAALKPAYRSSFAVQPQ